MIRLTDLLPRRRRARQAHAAPVRYRRSPDVSQAEHAGHITVIDADSVRYYGFAEVGAHVWTLLAGSRSVDEIITCVAAEYDAPLDRIREDVLSFLDQLLGARLIEREEAV